MARHPKRKRKPKRPKYATDALIPVDSISSLTLSNANGEALTLKQRVWIEEYLRTGNATLAARKAYPTADPKSHKSMGNENLSKLNLPISLVLDYVGLTDVKLGLALKAGLSARKVTIATYEGKIGETISHPDLATRKTYVELALKAKGHLRENIDLTLTQRDMGDYDGENPAEYIERALSGVPAGE